MAPGPTWTTSSAPRPSDGMNLWGRSRIRLSPIELDPARVPGAALAEVDFVTPPDLSKGETQ